MIARAIVFSILDLAFTMFACLAVNWWAPLFAVKDESGFAHLPNWLAWFDTFDADLDTGSRDFGLPAGYWGRVAWLYRNPAYGFGYWALGCRFSPDLWKVTEGADVHPVDFETATFRAESTLGHFCYYGVKWGIRIKFGWKARNQWSPYGKCWKPYPWGPEYRLPFVFSITRA